MKIDSEFKIDRSRYDDANYNSKSKFIAKPGISEDLVRKISSDKNEPEWMLKKRLMALKLFEQTPVPNWGPDLSELNLDEIVYYVDPDAEESRSWDDVPDDIKETFEKLGIPQAERESLAGVGSQYDSGMVYHNLKKEWEEKGIIFENMDVAVQKYPEMVKKYFMTNCVPVSDHKFAMLHAAVWSGGTFIYVPPGVKIDMPLQAYFRMNAMKGGQFEHTLIIADKGSEVSYIEGCFTEGNLVRTRRGLIPIEQMSIHDKVLSEDGKYHKIDNLQKNKYSGDLYEIEIYGDSTQKIETTFDHPFLWVGRERFNEKNKIWKKEWNIAKYIKKGDYLCIPRCRIVKRQQEKDFTLKRYARNKREYEKYLKNVKFSKELFKIVGYYLAEGSISKNSYLNFSFGSHERDLIEDVKNLMKKVFGIEKYHEFAHKKNNGISLVYSSVELCRLFKQFGTSCYTKKIPQWALYADFDFQKELLKGYWLGDGNIYKQKCNSGFKEVVRINTTSEKLAHQTKFLFWRLGIPAFINERIREKENRATMYTIGVSGFYLKELGEMFDFESVDMMHEKKRISMFHVDEDFIYVPIKSIIKKKVENINVYNLEVANTHTYTVSEVCVHNCSSPKYESSSLHAGCVEIHALEGSKVNYSSIENWSKNMYNLNTKRAIIHRNASIEWLSGQMGSGKTMLYPCSILLGENSKSESLGIAFAGDGQDQDVGTKVIHIGKNTSSVIKSKSISKDGGISSYRGLVKVAQTAQGAISTVECDALMVDDVSVSNTFPQMEVNRKDAQISHEARVGKIGDEEIFYLMSRGLSEQQAMQMIVNGFAAPVVKKLPLEYAVELNKLIEIEMENSLG